MAVTRIKNNQITDATIFANTKISPGSIVGSLFNANLTMTSDVTITGNLTVQGSSTYLTVASTNTYVNDPLIVLNNSYSGTNTYDIGLVINRGSLDTAALVWSEANDEFRVQYTTDDGTTYGSINNSGYANLHVGYETVESDLTVKGDLLTTATTFNLVNDTATTVNFAGGAGAVNIGDSTGNVTVGDGLVVTDTLWGTTAYLSDVYNSNLTASRITFADSGGQLTDDSALTYTASLLTVDQLSVDGSAGNVKIYTPAASNEDIIISADSGIIDFDGGALTNLADPVSAQDAVTLTYLESAISSDVTTIQQDDSYVSVQDDGVDPGWIDLTVDATQVANLLVGSMSVFADTLLVSDGSNVAVMNSATFYVASTATVDGVLTVTDTTTSTNDSTGALVVGGGVGVGENLNVGGTLDVTGAVNLNDTTSSTNATTGALIVDGGVGIAENLNVGGDATVTGNLTVNGDLTYVNSTDLNVTDKNITIADGAASGAAADGAGITVDGASATITYTNATSSWDFNLAVKTTDTTDSTSPTTGALLTAGGLGVAKDLYVGGGDIGTDQTTFNLINDTATTLNIGGAATALNLGAATGNVTVADGLVVTDNTWGVDAYFTDVTASANLTGADFTATASANLTTSGTVVIDSGTTGSIDGVNIGATTAGTGDFTDVTADSLNVNDTTASTYYSNGALIVDGGVGVAGNLNIQGGQILNVGGDLVSNVIYGDASAQVVSDVNGNARVIIQNINGGSDATSGLSILADDGDETNNFLDFGINSTGATFGEVDPGDAFIFYRSSGNLFVGTFGGDYNIVAAGGAFGNSVVAKADGGTLSFVVTSLNQSVDFNSGGLVVEGGAGFKSNINVASGLTVNADQTSQGFTVLGNVATSLIHTDSLSDSIILGGSNASPHAGATVKINATDSMIVPVGTTSERPSNDGGVDVAGMLRFNSTLNQLEYYSGSSWESTQGSFTTVVADAFAGDDLETDFTLSQENSTAGVIVSINGILQIPTTAYAVSGNVLTFTEAPATGDVIDIRHITTSTTVTGLADETSSINVNGSTDTATFTNADLVYVESKIKYRQTPTTITNASTPYVVASFNASTYATGKFIVQAVNGGNIESMEMMLITTGSDVDYTTYAVINAGYAMGTLSANVVAGNVQVYYTSTSLTGSEVKVMTTLIEA